jgi:hypothetical protein
MKVKAGHVVAVRQSITLGLGIGTDPALLRENVQFVADVRRGRAESASDTVGELTWIFRCFGCSVG